MYETERIFLRFDKNLHCGVGVKIDNYRAARGRVNDDSAVDTGYDVRFMMFDGFEIQTEVIDRESGGPASEIFPADPLGMLARERIAAILDSTEEES